MDQQYQNYVINTVADSFNVSHKEILSQKRDARLVKPRQVTMYIFRKSGLGLNEIAKILKRKDHTTVSYAVKKEDIKKLGDEIIQFMENPTEFQNPHSSDKNTHRYKKIFDQLGAKCMICSFDDIVEVHHLISPKLGGSNRIDNILILCPNHHAMLHAGLLKINNIKKICPNLCKIKELSTVRPQ